MNAFPFFPLIENRPDAFKNAIPPLSAPGLLLFSSLHRCGRLSCEGERSLLTHCFTRCTVFADAIINPPCPPIGRVMRLPFTLSADCA
jgi:hypothetical protein